VPDDAFPDFDNLTHHLVAHDVAGQHHEDEVVIEVQVRAADGAARYPDDRVAVVLDLGVRNSVAANVFFAVPDERFHDRANSDASHSC
jgi:hypothetical protein